MHVKQMIQSLPDRYQPFVKSRKIVNLFFYFKFFTIKKLNHNHELNK